MRFFWCFLLVQLILLGPAAFGQDAESPLLYNSDLQGAKKSVFKTKSFGQTFDSTFIYITDTLNLSSPFFDDFTFSKFQNLPNDFNDPALQEELYFRLLEVGTELPLPNGFFMTDSATFRLEINLIDDTIITHPFAPFSILYNPLTNYPVTYNEVNAYPPYIVIDTVDVTPTTPDTLWLNNVLYQQDSARIFISEINDPNKLWLTNQAYFNYRFARHPWSLGVVSFDGLDENGYPYNFGSSSVQMCDTLLSKPINLSTSSPADSVYFSFLFQTEGYGDAPEAEDSLLLEFYNPVEGQWSKVWRTEGGPLTDFKKAHIPVVNPDYFNNGFQFRFMNYGSPAGMLDHFHIDYVNFRRFSGHQDTLINDFAIVYPLSTLLKDYISVPWKHYKNSTDSKMSDEVRVTVRNSSVLPENNQNGTVLVSYDGVPEGTFTLNATLLSGGDINYAPLTTYETFHDFSQGYEYDRSVNDSMAIFDWEVNVSAQFPNYLPNDSTFGKQVFTNYYAYDDGSAERAYGVFGIQSQLAYKFEAYQPDSLIGVQIHFTPTVNDVSNNLFLLAVWDDDNGQPGNKIYEDQFFFPKQPVYHDGRNGFHMYYFQDTALVPVEETFYVGMRQINEERLNIGFDKNHNNQDKIFFSVDGGNNWNNANFEGSLMMRPIINSNLNYLLGLPEYVSEEKQYTVNVFPNPTTHQFRVETNVGHSVRFDAFDLNGRNVLQGNTEEYTVIEGLHKGMYILKISMPNGTVKTRKIIVQ
jgi:hypothetical protein